jgi:hypothetical protein
LTATDKIEDPWELARMHFEQFYWGSLASVEDKNVEARMVGFRHDFIGVEDKFRSGSLPDTDRKRLQKAALNVSHACRDLISTTWQLELPLLTLKQSTDAPPLK